MKFKLSRFATCGVAFLGLVGVTQANDSGPKQVPMSLPITFTLQVAQGLDVLSPRNKGAIYVRTSAKREGTFTMDVPAPFNIHLSSPLSDPRVKHPMSKMTSLVNKQNQIELQVMVNNQLVPLAFEIDQKFKVLRINADDRNAKIALENREMERKVQGIVGQLAKEYGAKITLDPVVDSRVTAETPTESLSVDPSGKELISYSPYSVTITGHLSYMDSESPDDLKQRLSNQ